MWRTRLLSLILLAGLSSFLLEGNTKQ